MPGTTLRFVRLSRAAAGDGAGGMEVRGKKFWGGT